MSPSDSAKKIPGQSLVSRYLVTIVMVPALIGMHYGWVLLQNNKSLVSEEEKIELPVITAAKYLWKRMQGTLPEKEQTSK